MKLGTGTISYLTPNLPELPEDEANGAIASIYEEIRYLGGVPMVALIFRHLATLPGALEWTWDALAPAWRSGQLQESAWRIAKEPPIEPIAPISRPALALLGVDDTGRDEIATVLAAYNRANPENLLSVLCLLSLAAGRGASRPYPSRPWIPPPAPGPLVAMGDVRSLSPDMAELLAKVGGPAPAGGVRVVQSLYRHFVHRPAFLALAVTLIRQRYDDGTLFAGASRVHEAMSRAAEEIVQGLSSPPAPDPGIVPVCSRFGGTIIPGMIVAGRLLDEAMAK